MFTIEEKKAQLLKLSIAADEIAENGISTSFRGEAIATAPLSEIRAEMRILEREIIDMSRGGKTYSLTSFCE